MSLSIGLSSGNIQENKTSSRNIERSILGAGLGLCAFKPIAKGTHKLFLIPYLKLKDSKSLTKYNSEYNGAIDSFINSSKLSTTGIKVYDLNQENFDSVSKIFYDSMPKSAKQKMLKSPVMSKRIKKTLLDVSKGENAFYNKVSNTIFINKEKLSWAVFHELGHAYNKKISPIGKLAQMFKIRSKKYQKYLAITSLLSILATNKKDKPKNKLDNVVQKIRNNAGIIAFSLSIPQIIEEGLASRNAAKFVKPYISKGAYKMLNKSNSCALLTYIGSGIASATAMVSMREIKDYIVARKNK